MLRKRASELLRELEEGDKGQQSAADAQKRIQRTNGNAAKAQQVAEPVEMAAIPHLCHNNTSRLMPTAHRMGLHTHWP